MGMLMGNKQLMGNNATLTDGQHQIASINDSSIYYSDDYGATWAITNSGSRGWKQLSINADGTIMLGAANSGCYISTDYGATWSVLPTLGTNYSEGIACSSDGQYILSGKYNNSVFLSTNYGSTFNSITSLGTGSWANGVRVSLTGQYMIVHKNDTNSFYFSNDYGVTWSTKTVSSLTRINRYDMSGDGKYILAANRNANGYVYISSDYGSTWSSVSAPSWYWQTVALNYDGVYQAILTNNSYKIYLSSNSGSSFTQNTGQGLTGGDGIAMSASGQYITEVSTGNYINYSVDYGATFSASNTTGNFTLVAIGKQI